MGCETNGHVAVNQYALVSYIPEPLGSFLDRLRLRLAPECKPHAHVTVLPPRPLRGTAELAEAELRDLTRQFHSFDVKLGDVQLFEATEVIYIAVECGVRELRKMHEELNAGAVQYDEPFVFHPHITLAQNLPHERVADTLRQAREMWSGWKNGSIFPVEELVFVQNTAQNVWVDLAHLQLAHEPAGIIR